MDFANRRRNIMFVPYVLLAAYVLVALCSMVDDRTIDLSLVRLRKE